MTGHEGNISPIWLFLLIGVSIIGVWGPKNTTLRFCCLAAVGFITLFTTASAGAATGSFGAFIIATCFFSYVGYLLFRSRKG